MPQIGAMYEGDASRKRTLVDHGFRLPSALDNRPLKWEEFLERVGQTVYLSATPGPYELSRGDGVVEQIIRPTGLVDPRGRGQAHRGPDRRPGARDPAARREGRTRPGHHLTKKMSEDLTDYLLELGIQVRYLHSDIDTLRRVELLRELRAGEFDVLVGINLLREGLDLPEVSLVAILDADKEGFLRSGTSLIQTIGRAARNVSGQVHMYADRITPAWRGPSTRPTAAARSRSPTTPSAASTRSRCARRSPASCDSFAREDADTEELLGSGRQRSRGKAPVPGLSGEGRRQARRRAALPAEELADLIEQLTEQMHAAAAELQFEVAARIRDELGDLKKELRQMREAGMA